jgi:flagellin
MPTINTNVAAIKARSNLDRVQREMDTSIARLSSGKRITTAKDDAAGSAIVGRMESQIRGLNMSIRHAKDGQSFVDSAEGALQEITGIFQRMRELAVQASSGVANATDKDYLNTEMKALVAEIAAIDANTKFNDRTIFTTTAMVFYTDIDVSGTAITAPTLEMSTAISPGFTSTVVSIGGGVAHAALSNAVSAIDIAIGVVDGKRANLGAISNRFDHIVDNLTNVVANTEAAKSRIEDADFAVETTQLTRNTVLQQAATSMIAQANASKNSILALIQG